MAASSLLICLDLQPSGLVDDPPPARRRRIAAARQVIDLARGGGWEVAHVCRAAASEPPTPLSGLGPLPCEAVYRRTGVSAFEARHFPELLDRRRGGTAAILGFDIGGAALVTALTAAERGHGVVLLTDAACGAPLVAAARGVAAVSGGGRLRLSLFRDVPALPDARLMMAANQP